MSKLSTTVWSLCHRFARRKIGVVLTASAIRLSLTIASLCLPLAGNAATYYVGTCKPGKAAYTTIQQAVSAVPAGSIVDVCPGTYAEQVIIQLALTLQGMQSGDGAGVTIAPPTSGLGTLEPSDVAAQIAVIDSGGPVNINGIIIDGTGITSLSLGTTAVASIVFDSSTGTIDHVVTQNLPQNFSQVNSSLTGGLAGIWVLDEYSVSPTVTVKNSLVNMPLGGLNEFGVFLPSGTANLDISNTSLLLTGTPPGGFGYGIYDYSTGTGTFTGNTIAGSFTGISVFSPGLWAGISSGNGTVSVTGNSITGAIYGVNNYSSSTATAISGNALINDGIGIETLDPNITIKGNQFYSVSYYTGIEFQCTSPAAIGGNLFVGPWIALSDVPPGASLKGTAGSYFGVQTIETLCP